MSIIGKRVRHNCGVQPECPLTGVVLDVILKPGRTMNNMYSLKWAKVKWSLKDGPYIQLVPLHRVKVIE